MISMQYSFHMFHEQSGQGWCLRRYGELNFTDTVQKVSDPTKITTLLQKLLCITGLNYDEGQKPNP